MSQAETSCRTRGAPLPTRNEHSTLNRAPVPMVSNTRNAQCSTTYPAARTVYRSALRIRYLSTSVLAECRTEHRPPLPVTVDVEMNEIAYKC
jgi:hypothetical protein